MCAFAVHRLYAFVCTYDTFFVTVSQGEKKALSAIGHFHFLVFNDLSNYKTTAHTAVVTLQVKFAMLQNTQTGS